MMYHFLWLNANVFADDDPIVAAVVADVDDDALLGLTGYTERPDNGELGIEYKDGSTPCLQSTNDECLLG